MPDALELLERPQKRPMVMVAGWRQWADAGSVSSMLPQYLIDQSGARLIGTIRAEGFYLFQLPGTHDLLRPVVEFEGGFPAKLSVPRNELFYTESGGRGVTILLGDEPHMDIERYIAAVLGAAQALGVERIIGLGGVYGELPYDKERMVSCNYSLPALRAELESLAVNFSDYHGGASIGSVLCKRASEQDIAYAGLYAFVPLYNVGNVPQLENLIRIEHDFTAWLGIMRRVNYLLKTRFDLTDLERKSRRLLQTMQAQIEELERKAPQLGVREYFARLSEDFTEMTFNPLDDVWEDALRGILDDEDTPADDLTP